MTTTELPRGESGRAGTGGTEWIWLRDDLPALLRLATLLTGDPARAGSLVAQAVVREKPRRDEFPEARLRRLVVQRYLASGPGSVRDRLARACLVLRYGEGLTLAETATVLDRPVSQVATELSHDELNPQELRATLTKLADTAPDSMTVLTELDRASHQVGVRRRRRLSLIVLAGVVAALLVLVPVVVLPRLPGETRTAGDWTMVHRVKPPPGWEVVEDSISPTVESTTLRSDLQATTVGATCQIQVYVPGGLDLAKLPAQRDPVRVRGHQGFFSEGDSLDFGPFLAYSYATDAWTLVQCPRDAQLDRTKLMAFAYAVTYRRSSMALPFKLTSLPAGYRVESATQGVTPTSGELILAMTEIRVGDANMAITYSPLDTPDADDAQSQAVNINGRSGFLDSTSSHPRLCLEEDQRYVCIAAYWPLGDWPARAPLPVNMPPVLTETAQALELPEHLDQTDTWFATADAIPTS